MTWAAARCARRREDQHSAERDGQPAIVCRPPVVARVPKAVASTVVARIAQT